MNTSDRAYSQLPPNIGLNPQQVRVLAEEGRARIAAENAAKEVERKEKQENNPQQKGWKGKMEQGLERVKRKLKGTGESNFGNEEEYGQGGGK